MVNYKQAVVTKWPQSLPHEDEEYLLSIVCGNSHLHWAFHHGLIQDASPTLFWRTPPLKEQDFKSGIDPTEVLSRHLPQFVHDFLFGKEIAPSERAAMRKKTSTERPELSIYVVSAVTEQTSFLSQLWSCVPCKIYLMKGDDFFTTEEGRYDGMGVDRLAALRGAAGMFGFPSLVFDGGTAWTYTATDKNGRLVGGGIGPGMNLKFRSLKEYTDALPKISPSQVSTRVNQAITSKTTLPFFALNTSEGMMTTILSGFILMTKKVIEKWFEVVGNGVDDESQDSKSDGIKSNTRRIICITGGDGEILSHLIGGKSEQIIDLNENMETFLSSKNCTVRHQKHLVHYGIASAIMNQMKGTKTNIQKQKTPNQKKNESTDIKKYLGSRVAKEFDTPDDSGDYVFRGSVVGIQRTSKEVGEKDQDLFLIRYDDDDQEHVTEKDLIGMINFFSRVGEKKKESPKALKKEKKESSSTQTMEGKMSSNKKNVNTSKDKSEPGKRKALAASTTPKTKKTKVEIKKKDPKDFIQKRVSKWFDKDLYFGTVTAYDSDEQLWRVMYDDDDEEEFDDKELREALSLYEKKKRMDTKNEQATTQGKATNPPKTNGASKSNGDITNDTKDTDTKKDSFEVGAVDI